MATVIVQVSDVHLGGPNEGAGRRLSHAVDAINEMTWQPDLVVLTGDLTHTGAPSEWSELRARMDPLAAPWTALPGNHDRRIEELAGHRALDVGDLHVVLLDTSADEFGDSDATWLDTHLAAHADRRTALALHHPPFETGIWWMDVVGLRGAPRVEAIVRRHTQVHHVMSGHVHRPITTCWAGCLLTVCPSTSVAVAGDLDGAHDPAETAEPPMIAVHAYLPDSVVSHVVPVGPAATRSSISAVAPDFVAWARDQQRTRSTAFVPSGV